MSRAHLHDPDAVPGLTEALAAAGVDAGDASEGLVFLQRTGGLSGFPDIRHEMLLSFRLSKQAASAGAPAVYVLWTPDLLGQRGPLPAMLANGLVSAARSMGMEGLREDRTSNALAFDTGTDPATMAFWISTLLDGHGVTGELVGVGSGHLGKVVP